MNAVLKKLFHFSISNINRNWHKPISISEIHKKNIKLIYKNMLHNWRTHIPYVSCRQFPQKLFTQVNWWTFELVPSFNISRFECASSGVEKALFSLLYKMESVELWELAGEVMSHCYFKFEILI